MTTTQDSAVAVELITVVIDGFEVSVPKGTLVIRAAEKLGIQIPRFCDHPLLDPVGACRQCLVDIEINGRAFPKPQASCTIPVEPNMIVKTQLTSPVADKAQQVGLAAARTVQPVLRHPGPRSRRSQGRATRAARWRAIHSNPEKSWSKCSRTFRAQRVGLVSGQRRTGRQQAG